MRQPHTILPWAVYDMEAARTALGLTNKTLPNEKLSPWRALGPRTGVAGLATPSLLAQHCAGKGGSCWGPLTGAGPGGGGPPAPWATRLSQGSRIAKHPTTTLRGRSARQDPGADSHSGRPGRLQQLRGQRGREEGSLLS
jgi:hypothetical protein